jgi:Type II site-specific deoxyribonuclease
MLLQPRSATSCIEGRLCYYRTMGKGTGGGGTRNALSLAPVVCVASAASAPVVTDDDVPELRYAIKVHEQTDIITPELALALGADIGQYEAFAGGRLTKQVFENVFGRALQRAGHKVTRPKSQTNPGHDLTIDGVKWSLKTEGSKQLRPGMIYISKFMESAGVRNFKSTKDALARVERIHEHLARYERIVVLRSWSEEHEELGETTRYELIEIPKTLFADGFAGLRAKDFSPLTATKTTRAPLTIDGEEIARLHFDGSDEKVTFSRISTKHCLRHATWWIPLSSGIDHDGDGEIDEVEVEAMLDYAGEPSAGQPKSS